MLGISWGIVSVVMLLAYGDGFHAGARRAASGAPSATASSVIWPGPDQHAGRRRARRQAHPHHACRRAAIGELPLVKASSPEFMQRVPDGLGRRSRRATACAAWPPSYGVMRSQRRAGRAASSTPRTCGCSAAWCSSAARWRRKLFGNAPPVGETIRIDGHGRSRSSACRRRRCSSRTTSARQGIASSSRTRRRASSGTPSTSTLLVYQAVDAALRAAGDAAGARKRSASGCGFDPADERALRMFGSARPQEITAGITLGLKLVLDVHRRADAGHRRRRRDEHHVRLGAPSARARSACARRSARGAARSCCSSCSRAWPRRSPAAPSASLSPGLLVWLLSPRPFLSELLDDATRRHRHPPGALAELLGHLRGDPDGRRPGQRLRAGAARARGSTRSRRCATSRFPRWRGSIPSLPANSTLRGCLS